MGKITKGGNIHRGYKRKIFQGSQTASLQGNVGPSDGDTSGTQRQAANQNRQVVAAVLGEDVVYHLIANSALCSGFSHEYPAGEQTPQRGQLVLMWEQSAQF